MTEILRLGFSSCPNDTFMFHGLVSGDVAVSGTRFAPVIEDIESLNQRALGEGGDDPIAVTKLSVGVLGHVTERYRVLQSGAALGHGVGPLVVKRRGDRRVSSLDDLRGRVVAIPGLRTTAHLLLRLFAPEAEQVRPMRFDQIMPGVADGGADAGVVIHEGRFTYEQHGLEIVADLGELWERAAQLPLPLGVIAARRDLDPELVEAIDAGLATSIERALAEPARSRAFVREHAQELSDLVCDRHIELYVNEYSRRLGSHGRRAVEELLRRGAKIGFFPTKFVAPW